MNSVIALYTKFHYMTQIIMALYVDKLCNFYLQDQNIMKPGNHKIRFKKVYYSKIVIKQQYNSIKSV